MNQATLEAASQLVEAVRAWGRDVRTDPRDLMPPGDVYSALLDIRLATKDMPLPDVLIVLQDDAKTHESTYIKGGVARKYEKFALLQFIDSFIENMSEVIAKSDPELTNG